MSLHEAGNCLCHITWYSIKLNLKSEWQGKVEGWCRGMNGRRGGGGCVNQKKGNHGMVLVMVAYMYVVTDGIPWHLFKF